MTLLIVLAALNLVVGALVLYAVFRPKPPVVFSAPAHRGAMPSLEHTPTLPRYTVTHGDQVLYDGHDSDLAVATWHRTETAPDQHPADCQFYENGRLRGRRTAQSSPSGS